MTNDRQVINRWYATIALVRDLSLDPRLTGLASGYAEKAALELEKLSQEGICDKPAEDTKDEAKPS